MDQKIKRRIEYFVDVIKTWLKHEFGSNLKIHLIYPNLDKTNFSANRIIKNPIVSCLKSYYHLLTMFGEKSVLESIRNVHPSKKKFLHSQPCRMIGYSILTKLSQCLFRFRKQNSTQFPLSFGGGSGAGFQIFCGAKKQLMNLGGGGGGGASFEKGNKKWSYGGGGGCGAQIFNKDTIYSVGGGGGGGGSGHIVLYPERKFVKSSYHYTIDPYTVYQRRRKSSCMHAAYFLSFNEMKKCFQNGTAYIVGGGGGGGGWVWREKSKGFEYHFSFHSKNSPISFMDEPLFKNEKNILRKRSNYTIKEDFQTTYQRENGYLEPIQLIVLVIIVIHCFNIRYWSMRKYYQKIPSINTKGKLGVQRKR